MRSAVSQRSRLLSHVAAFAGQLQIEAAPPPSNVNSNGMLLNSSITAYYSNTIPILDWWRNGGVPNIGSSITANNGLGGQLVWYAKGTASAGGGTSYFDPTTGEIANPAPSDLRSVYKLFITEPPGWSNTDPVNMGPTPGVPWWNTEWIFSWEGNSYTTGQPSLLLGGGTGFTLNYNSDPTTGGTGSFTLNASIGNTELNFPVGNPNNPPVKIKLYQAQYATNIANGEFFNPDWKKDIEPFRVFRMLQWNTIVNGISDISQYATQDYAHIFGQPAYGGADVTQTSLGSVGGVPTAFVYVNGFGGNKAPGMAITSPVPTTTILANTQITAFFGFVLATVAGTTFHSGDTVSVILTPGTNSTLTATVTKTYTLGASESATTIAAGLAALVNADTTLSACDLKAQASGPVLTLFQQSNIYVVVTPTFSVTGTGNETITLSPYPIKAAVGGTVSNIGDVINLTISSLTGSPASPVTVSFTTISGSTTTTIATGLTAAINANSTLQAAGVWAIPDGTVVIIGQFVPGGLVITYTATGAETVTVAAAATTFAPNNDTGTYAINNAQNVVGQNLILAAVPGLFANKTGFISGAVGPSLACRLANECNINIRFPLPQLVTPTLMTQICEVFEAELNPGLYVEFELCDENWNSLPVGTYGYWWFIAQYYPGQEATGYPEQMAGYTACKAFETAYNVFGAAGRSRWRGILGGQMAAGSTASFNAFEGALYWLQNGSARPYLTDLVDEINIAPYFGAPLSSHNITAATTGTTTTLTCSNSFGYATFTGTISGQTLTTTAVTGSIVNGDILTAAGVPANCSIIFQIAGTANGAGTYWISQPAGISTGIPMTTASVVRIYFATTTTGTLGQTTGYTGGASSPPGGTSIVNGQDFILTAASSSSISFTNYYGNSGSAAVNTTGLTFPGTTGGAFCAPGLFFEMYDESVAFNLSDPTDYPTPYTYFMEQYCKGLLLGATDNGWLANPDGGFLGPYKTSANSYQYILQQHALLGGIFGQAYGNKPIQLGFYEAGLSLSGITDSNLGGSVLTPLPKIVTNAMFDTGSNGKTYNAKGAYLALANICQQNNSPWPGAQYCDGGYNFPFNFLAFWPGNENNGKYLGAVAASALGAYVDPTPPATGTYAYLGSNYVASAPTATYAQTFTANFGSNSSNTLALIGLQWTGATISSITVGSTTLSLVTKSSSGNYAYYSGLIPANSGTQTVTINWTSASGHSLGAFVYSLQNLTSTTPQTIGPGGGTTGYASGGNTIQMTEGAAVIGLIDSSTITVLPGYGAGALGINPATLYGVQPVTPVGIAGPWSSGLWNFEFSSTVLGVTFNSLIGTNAYFLSYR